LWLIAAAWMRDHPLMWTNIALTTGGLIGWLLR
jgi:hypothetical protein